MRKYLTLILTGLIITGLLSGCGKMKSAPVQMDCYSVDMPTMFLSNAVTLNDIAQAENYEPNAILSYKDDTSYIFYNRNAMVVLAQSGTDFNYSNLKDVGNYDIMGTHFTKTNSSKKISGGYKIPVSASVSLTNLIYGDYDGTLVILEGTPEVAVFIGTVAGQELTYKKKQVVKQIVNSVKYSQPADGPNFPTYQGAETPSKDSNEPKEEPQEEPKVQKDSYTIKSYDVNGNPIEENLLVTNVYREMPSFIKTDRTPAVGTHFECVEYSLDHSPMEEFYYVNVHVKGIEGKRMAYRGVSYPKRTYDYFDLMTDNYEKIYCYYEIPNGLKEYSLEFLNEIEHNSSKFTLYCK